MSALEQFIFAIAGVAILTAALALSDPHIGIAAALRGATANPDVPQSCATR